MSRFKKLLAAALILPAVAVLFITQHGHASGTTTTINASADSYVSATYPTTNFGTKTYLYADGSPDVKAVIGFAISGLNGAQITSATLRVYAQSSNSGGISAAAYNDSDWTETGITYNTYDSVAAGDTLATAKPVTSGQWVSFDVSPAVKSEGSFSFVLLPVNTTNTKFASREAGASFAPQLVITTAAAAQPTVSLSATPSTINSGQSSTLNWSSTNATACTASGAWSGSQPVSGSVSTGVLNQTSTYTMTCTGTGGSGSASTTVTVSGPPLPTVSLSASPQSINQGDSSTLNWSSTNADSCTASGGWSGSQPVSGSQSTGALNQSTTYTLTCTGTGGSNSASTTVNVTPLTTNLPPTVSLSASPSSIYSGQSSTLNWSSTNADACTASGGWSGSKSTSGSSSTGALSQTATYTLTCTGAGGSASDSATVTVSPAPAPTVSLSASPSSITASQTSNLNWNSTNASSCTASGGWSGSQPTAGTASTGALSQTSAYTLTCSGAGGSASSSATVTVSQPSGDPVIAAAGDIACDPSNTSFKAGTGSGNACRQSYTASLLQGSSAVLLLGDNQYYCGGYQAFTGSYDLSWGKYKSITHPAVGNHEYLTSGGTGCTSSNAGASGYFQYFGAAAGTKGQGYYSFNVGSWHLIALNSNCSSAGGCGATSPQGQWLAADLAAHPTACTLAYYHIPLWSSGGRAASNTAPLVQILYNNNADVIIAAHDHIYERFKPQNPSGQVDTSRGITEFLAGTGGANHTSIATVQANSVVRDVTTFGVLKLTLHTSSYDWKFVPASFTGNGTFTDSGSGTCH